LAKAYTLIYNAVMLQEFKDKIKGWGTEIFIIFVAILAVLTVVGGVRFFMISNHKSEIEFRPQAFIVGFREDARERNFVASKNGAKYYPVGCKSSNRIKEENKIFFESEQDAVKAGFDKTAQCK
jgi:hypothetical protein